MDCEAEQPPKRAALSPDDAEADLSPFTFFNLFEQPSADMRSLFTPAVTHAIVATMSLDLAWALEYFPALLTIPSVFLASHPPRGECLFPSNIRFAEPVCGAYGVPHGKLFCLMERTRIRVIITTANLVETDFTQRANAFWTQSFPLRAADTPLNEKIGYVRPLERMCACTCVSSDQCALM